MIYKNNSINVTNSDEAFAKVLEDLLNHGQEISAGDSKSVGANSKSKELLQYSIQVQFPRERLIYNLQKRLTLPATVARFVWMMAASDRLQDISFYEEKVKFFSDDGVSIPGSNYGQRMLQPRPGVNQLTSVIQTLKKDPSTRRASISIYHPEDAGRESKDIPCTFGLFYNIRNNQLHATTVMRSNNAFVLLPYNLFEFSLLAEIIATEVGVTLGSLTHFAVSMHIYESNYQQAESVVTEYKTNGFNSNIQMPVMPAMPSPIEQTKQLVILEAQLRHASAGVSATNIEEWIEKGRSKLNVYWQQFYFLLLFHIVKKKNDGLALNALEQVIEEPYNSYLPKEVAPDKSTMEPIQETFNFMSQDASNNQVIPVFSSNRLLSLGKIVDSWEAKNKKVLTRQEFSKLQDHFLTTVAARNSNLEVTSEELEEVIGKLLS